MKMVRFGVFGLILAAIVAFAVSTLVAQAPAPAPEPQRDRDPMTRSRVMLLDGRGSQIGVMVQDLAAEDLKNGLTNGVRVDDVDRDSPAAKAGVHEGDIVVEYDGERIRSARQFSRLVQETAGGRSVKIGIVRNGQRQTLDVTPESGPFAFGVDGDRIGADVARSLRDIGPRLREQLEPQMRQFRELEPRMRDFRYQGPLLDFDGVIPRTGRARLGVQLESLTPQLATYFGVKDGGVLVSSVTEDSPAAKAGLKAGDVITSVNGDRVRDYEGLINELNSAQANEVTLGIVRDKKESTVKATLEDARPRTRRPARPA
jgi:serine protease Do